MTSPTFSKAIEHIKSVPQALQNHVLEFIRVLTNSTIGKESNQQLAVKGTYQNGIVEIEESLNERNGQAVIVTFLAEPPVEVADGSCADDSLEAILNDCQMSTGISDLASQHDHYRHGTPKRKL